MNTLKDFTFDIFFLKTEFADSIDFSHFFDSNKSYIILKVF